MSIILTMTLIYLVSYLDTTLSHTLCLLTHKFRNTYFMWSVPAHLLRLKRKKIAFKLTIQGL